MNKLNMFLRTHMVFVFIAAAVLSITAYGLPAQDLRADEIAAKHVNSIGTKEKLASVQNRMALGVSEFESKLPAKKTGGKALVASQGDDVMFLSSFMSKEYPFEKIGLFSEKVSLPWVTAGTRSPLGAFIADHDKILTSGLFAGTISSAWALLDADGKKGRFRSAGTKKIDDRRVYVLDFFPKGGGSSEFTIQLFIDSETFYHVRSEYRHVITSRQDTFGTLGRQAGVRLVMTEEYDDFKTVEGLTLPHSYKITYLTDSNSGVFEYIWGIKVSQYLFNQKLATNFFTFDAKR